LETMRWKQFKKLKSGYQNNKTMYNPQNLNECEKEKKRNARKYVDTLMTGIGGVASASGVPQILKIWQWYKIN